MLSFTSRLFSRWGLGGLLTLGALPQVGQAQCNCTQTITSPPAYQSVLTVSSGTLCITSGVTWQGAAIHVTGNNVTICNQGTIGENYSGNGYGVIDVDAGLTGVVINNLGTISTQTMKLHAAVALTNGSSDAGATVAAGATWQGSLANTDRAPVISNYASWQAQAPSLPGGTITNAKGATWNGYLTTSAALSITNAGTWASQVQEAGNSPTISIVHNGGTWSGSVGGGNGSLRITNNATWTQGFNFPGGNNNAFSTSAGATTTCGSYLGLGGRVALVNNGAMTLTAGMGSLGAGSTLTLAAGSAFTLTGDFNNQGAVLTQGRLAVVGNFTNSGTIAGAAALPQGRITASGYTVNSGSFGTDGSYLDFCDSTPTVGQGFDSQGGSIGSRVTFCAPTTNSTPGPLPITLTSFTAQPRQGQVVVQWTTASEQGNKQFVVERGADGQNFVALHAVAGQGTTAIAHRYAYLDAQPLPGRSYYRLRQVDLDGTSTYAPVANILLDETTPLLYPNPTAGRLVLDLRATPAEACEVQVLSTLGQLVLHETLTGGQEQFLALDQLPAGTYLVRLSRPGQGYTVQRVEKR